MKLSAGLLALGLAASETSAHSTSPATQNANHIFNAVHSSMRQWGSSVLHNGMTLFMATVPEGTQLYHGTSQSERINHTEWLAFEPEHALVFARARRPGPPGRGGPPGDGPDRNHGPEEEWHSPESVQDYLLGSPKQGLKPRYPHEPHEEQRPTQNMAHHKQTPLNNDQSAPKADAYGFLHTYRAKHDLRLLYLDGQSAAKSSLGTLDMSDVILLHHNPPPQDGPPRRLRHDKPEPSDDNIRRPHIFKDKEPPKNERPKTGGPFSEGFRAEHLCELAENEWQGKIDGFLRMELGFEIILCSFKDGLDLDRITHAKSQDRAPGPGDSINYYKAVASRFDGIGGNRVHVDYDKFVTLYAFDDAVHFDKEGLPRANNKTKVVEPVLEAITAMILSKHSTNTSFDWQAISDMVISRYSDRIEYLASAHFETEQSLKDEIERAIRPYIDYSNRNTSLEIFRCATQYFHTLPPPKDSIAANAILDVTTYLCSALFSASQQDYDDALSTVRSLKRWLGWTTFKRCRGCAANEVCFIPIWPLGGKEDFENPRCVWNMSETGRGYWGGFGGGGGGGGGPPHKEGRRV